MVEVEEVGQLFISLKQELNLLREGIENMPQSDLANQIKQRLKRVENSLQQKAGNVLNQMISNQEKTLQELDYVKLPQIRSETQQQPIKFPNKQTSYRDRYSKNTVGNALLNSSYRINPAISVKQTIINERNQLFLENPSSSVTHSIFRNKFALKSQEIKLGRPVGGITYQRKKKFLKPFQLHQEKVKEEKQDKLKQLDKGMYSLINQGIINKNEDLSLIFQSGAPTIISAASQMHKWDERFDKPTEITSGIVPQNLKFDLQKSPQSQIVKVQPSPKNVQTGELQLAIFQPIKEQKQNLSVEKPQDKQKKEEPREYDELIDTYSLHHFMIRKGRTIEQTPEFISYKRIFWQRWTSIKLVIQKLEQFLALKNIPIAYIDGKKLAYLAQDELNIQRLQVDQILNCIVNLSEVLPLIQIPGRMFKGNHGKEFAAISIQSAWRMFKAHRAYRKLKVFISKAIKIQKAYRKFISLKKTRQKIDSKRELEFEHFKQVQQKFKQNWGEIKTKPRIEIHLNS